MTKKRQKRGDEHYVNNKEFTDAVSKYALECREAEKGNKDRPQMPNYIGNCVMKIAHRIAKRPNFSNYTYIDDMIHDAIEGCVYGLHKFDPEKSDNAFAYATTICFNKFIQRLNKEKEQAILKQTILENINIDFEVSDKQDGDNTIYHSDFKETHSEYMHDHLSIWNSIDMNKQKERKKRSIPSNISNLGSYIEDDTDEDDNDTVY